VHLASLIAKQGEIVGVLVEERERRRDESLNDAADG
jgi:hypothetical protein